MQWEFSQRDSPLPDEGVARQRCLRSGAEAPDLVTVKDFLHFLRRYQSPSIVQQAHRRLDQDGGGVLFSRFHSRDRDRHERAREG